MAAHQWVLTRWISLSYLASLLIGIVNRKWRRALVIRLRRQVVQILAISQCKREGDLWFLHDLTMLLLFDEGAKWGEIEKVIRSLTAREACHYCWCAVSFFWIHGRYDEARAAARVWCEFTAPFTATTTGWTFKGHYPPKGCEFEKYYLDARTAHAILDWCRQGGDQLPPRYVRDLRMKWYRISRVVPLFPIPFGYSLASAIGMDSDTFGDIVDGIEKDDFMMKVQSGEPVTTFNTNAPNAEQLAEDSRWKQSHPAGDDARRVRRRRKKGH